MASSTVASLDRPGVGRPKAMFVKRTPTSPPLFVLRHFTKTQQTTIKMTRSRTKVMTAASAALLGETGSLSGPESAEEDESGEGGRQVVEPE